MKYNNVYIVIHEGDVVYASTDKESAEGYADEQMYNAREAVLDEWENDDPTEKDIEDADWQVGLNGDFYEVIKVNISNKMDDDTLELPNGDEVDVSDILEKLRTYE